MSSLVSGNSILHIANRLGDVGRKECSEVDMDLSCLPPPVNETLAEVDPPLIFRLFKDAGKNSYSTVPSNNPSNTSTPTISVEEQAEAAGRPPEPEENAPPAFDIMQAVSQMQKELSNCQNIFGGTNFENASTPSQENILTMRDLLPGYSPWLRNAGRKKSHPVWDFFKDLKDTNGVGGVVCLHCNWSGDDRSPNNLRTHLKKFHTADGIFGKFSAKLAQKLLEIPQTPSVFLSFLAIRPVLLFLSLVTCKEDKIRLVSGELNDVGQVKF